MMLQNRRDAHPFITLDSSTIREIFHPGNMPSVNLSLAEATIDPGKATLRHIHTRTQEIYYILRGKGRMHLGKEESIVGENDAVLISQGTEHYMENVGEAELVFLCCCTPPYSDEDTDILDI